MKLVIAACLILLLSGCALHPRLPYTSTEKVMLITAIGGQVGDYVSTKRGLSRGCVEGNPLLQNQGVLIGTKIVFGGAIYLVSNAADTHTTRKVWLGLMSIIGWGVTWHNEAINCGGN